MSLVSLSPVAVDINAVDVVRHFIQGLVERLRDFHVTRIKENGGNRRTITIVGEVGNGGYICGVVHRIIFSSAAAGKVPVVATNKRAARHAAGIVAPLT